MSTNTAQNTVVIGSEARGRASIPRSQDEVIGFNFGGQVLGLTATSAWGQNRSMRSC